MTSIVERAGALFHQGRAQDGIDLLGEGASRDDPDALVALSQIVLAGRIVARDKAVSRDLMRRAALAGRRDAAAVYRAFVANGTGAPPDWAEAVRLLEEAAPTDEAAAWELDVLNGMTLDAEGFPVAAFRTETLSDNPEIRLFEDLFSAAECDFLVRAATPLLTPSVVVDPRTGKQVRNPIRTSDAAAFPLMDESPAIVALNRRLAAASGTVIDAGEPLQVLRYRPGQEYRPHLDAIPNTDNQRVMTFLVYLNDGYDGGQTDFPRLAVRVEGRKGLGLLFRNADSHGRPDARSEHAGLPILDGEKLIASRWIHERRFAPS